MASKDQIADVFEKRVERFGYQKTTLDEVASDLPVSKKTLYAHFDGKADIYRNVVGRIAKHSRAELAAAVAQLPTYGEKLVGVVGLVPKMGRAHIAETERSEWEAEYAIAQDAFAEAF